MGAAVPRSVPVTTAALALAVALATRRGALACVAVLALASGLAQRSVDGLAPPLPHAVQGGMVALADDPRPVGRVGVAVTVRYDGHRYDAIAFGRAAGALRPRLAGDRLWLDGTVGPLSARARRTAATRHVVAQLQIAVVHDWVPGPVVGEAANRVRRTLARGTTVLPATDAALVRGLVLGDDRDEPAATIEAFRASGLAHLTAVSGENVAFLLIVAGPLLRRLGLRGRWMATVALVAWFALLTRFEPSVLRACSMAGLAATARLTDRRAGPLRLLALVVAGLTLLDPMLVRAAGWWLSVGATAGLSLFTGPLARRLPGPRAVVEPLAATAAAQLGVLPVELLVFGHVPLLAVPANLLAGPAAAFVMVWGLPAGLAAGLGPPWLARLVHLPTLVAVRWIQLVAAVTARAPLVPSLLVLGLVGAAVVTVARRRRPVTSAPP